MIELHQISEERVGIHVNKKIKQDIKEDNGIIIKLRINPEIRPYIDTVQWIEESLSSRGSNLPHRRVDYPNSTPTLQNYVHFTNFLTDRVSWYIH